MSLDADLPYHAADDLHRFVGKLLERPDPRSTSSIARMLEASGFHHRITHPSHQCVIATPARRMPASGWWYHRRTAGSPTSGLRTTSGRRIECVSVRGLATRRTTASIVAVADSLTASPSTRAGAAGRCNASRVRDCPPPRQRGAVQLEGTRLSARRDAEKSFPVSHQRVSRTAHAWSRCTRRIRSADAGARRDV